MKIILRPGMFTFVVHLYIACALGYASGDVLNAEYRIENQSVQLRDGRCEKEAAPGSATKIITRVLGEPAYGDLDGNGSDDAAVFLIQETGGSGTFFFVAAAIHVNGRWKGTHAVFIGDRVAPEEIRIRDGVVVVKFRDRRADQPMAQRPTIHKSVEFEVAGDQLRAIQP